MESKHGPQAWLGSVIQAYWPGTTQPFRRNPDVATFEFGVRDMPDEF